MGRPVALDTARGAAGDEVAHDIADHSEIESMLRRRRLERPVIVVDAGTAGQLHAVLGEPVGGAADRAR